MSVLYENLLEYFNLPLKTISIFCVLSDYFQIPVKPYFMFERELSIQSCLTPTLPDPLSPFSKTCVLGHGFLSPGAPVGSLCAISSPTRPHTPLGFL